MNHRISLDQVQIANPCPANWEEMSGSGSVRFCQHCQKHVHNLSMMSRSDAEQLVCHSAGKLCVRYQPDAQGHVMTLDYAPSLALPFWKKWLPVAAVGGAIASALIYFGFRKETPKPAPMLMGDIAFPMPPSNPSPDTTP